MFLENSELSKNWGLEKLLPPSAQFVEIALCFFDGRPEAEIHRSEDDQASSDMKGMENSF